MASRREAEAWITAGRVSVNGQTLESPAHTVTATDTILVDGNPLPDAAPPRLWRYHKPAGLITTRSDPQGRETVFDKLPPGLPRVLTVGRLDLNSEGLLLLTNDGAVSRHLEMPSTGWSRRYRVRVFGTVDEKALAGLAQGCKVSGIQYGPIEARLERQIRGNAWLQVMLREGKNREVRKVLESLGLTVNRLIRVAYGPFQLGNLAKGAVEEVKPNILRDQIGEALGPPKTHARGPKGELQKRQQPKTQPSKTQQPKAQAAKPKPRKAKQSPKGAPRADRRRRP